jgi:hypothetical protein
VGWVSSTYRSILSITYVPAAFVGFLLSFELGVTTAVSSNLQKKKESGYDTCDRGCEDEKMPNT